MIPTLPTRIVSLRPARRIIVALGLVLGLGACATARTSVALRGADDLRPAEGERYVLPDSARAEVSRSWGFLSADSLVIYRPEFANERRARDGRTRYRREVEKVGRGGVAISGYRLADGRYVKYEGTVRREGDDLVFEPRPRRSLEAPLEPLRLPATEVQSVNAYFPSVGNTVLMFTAIGLMALTGAALSIASSMRDSAM